MPASYLREVADELVAAFTGVFRFDPDPALDEKQNVDKAIHETGVVAGLIACVQPIPAADVFVLAPLHVKLALQIGRIKGFEVTQERAGEIVTEVTGAAWMALTTQALIGIVGKVIPMARVVLTYPLNYAATWAIGQVTAHYFDCLRLGQVPSPQELEQLFKQQLQVGRRKGEALDGDTIKAKAEALRRKVAERDPRLRTKTRLRPKQRPALPRAPQGAAPPDPSKKLKIVLKPKADEAQDAAVGKTLGRDEPRRELEIGFKAADKTLGAAPTPAPESASGGATLAELVGDLADLPQEPEEAPAADDPGLVDQLERLARLRAQGVLDEEEFRRAKELLLGE